LASLDVTTKQNVWSIFKLVIIVGNFKDSDYAGARCGGIWRFLVETLAHKSFCNRSLLQVMCDLMFRCNMVFCWKLDNKEADRPWRFLRQWLLHLPFRRPPLKLLLHRQHRSVIHQQIGRLVEFLVQRSQLPPPRGGDPL
jgi:hypothetical protein